MLTNMTDEYMKYKNRVEQVTDHNYVLQLRKEVENSKEQINNLQR